MNRFLIPVFFVAVLTGCPGGDDRADAGTRDGGEDAGLVIDGGGGDAGACEVDLRPSARAETMGVFDPVRRNLIFYGGDDGAPVQCNPGPRPLDELWVFDADCAKFAPITTSGGPGGRARGMAVYDARRDRMILFGGRYRVATSGTYQVFNDVWALDLSSFEWTELQTTGGPPAARSNPAGTYDSVNDELVLFGGNTSTSGLSFLPLNDVWALNLETLIWRQIPASGNVPEARLFHSAVVDDAGGRLFIYGGGDAGAFLGPFLGDLWVFDLTAGTWELLHPGGSGAPMSRIWSTITYDARANRVILFGGHDDGAVGNNNDTWEFDLTNGVWNELVPPRTVNAPANAFCDFPPDFVVPNLAAPERRSAQLAALDEGRGEWIVFGGKTDCGIIDDVWVFDLARDSWLNIEQSTTGESCVRGADPTLCVAMCQ